MLWWYCRLVYSMSLCSPVFSSWFFEVLGYSKASKPNIANGVLMAVVFFLVRIAVMPVYYSRMCSVYGTEAFYKVSFGGRSAWIFSSICLDIMNIMWMHKIARGCYKVLRSRRKSKPESQENGKNQLSEKKGHSSFTPRHGCCLIDCLRGTLWCDNDFENHPRAIFQS